MIHFFTSLVNIFLKIYVHLHKICEFKQIYVVEFVQTHEFLQSLLFLIIFRLSAHNHEYNNLFYTQDGQFYRL